MSGRLLLSALPGEQRVFRLDSQDRLKWLRILREDRPGAAGDLMLGRVETLDPGLNAAFVDIGLQRPGLLPLSKRRVRPNEGETVAVRISRAPSDDKGARLVPAGDLPLTGEGRVPRLLKSGDDPVEMLRAEQDPPQEILVDDLETYTRVRHALRDRPELLDGLQHHRGPQPLIDAVLAQELEALLQPFVPLPGGGSLLIEPVRTLTAIDVNAGRHPGSGARRAVEVNREAATEIVRQLRLRDLSGRILIDFLEMEGRREREALAAFLRERLADDPEPVQLFPPRGQLFELTRRRSRPPLHELLARRCGMGGGGWERDPVAVAYELLRQVAAAPATAHFELRVAPAVSDSLSGQAAAARAAIEARRGGKVIWKVEPARGIDESELVLW
jgi:ribonuclease G